MQYPPNVSHVPQDRKVVQWDNQGTPSAVIDPTEDGDLGREGGGV